MNAAELKTLRGPLILLLLAIAAAAGAIYYTHQLRLQAQVELTKQQVRLREAQTRMQRSGDEKSIIVQYVDQYRQLQQTTQSHYVLTYFYFLKFYNDFRCYYFLDDFEYDSIHQC